MLEELGYAKTVLDTYDPLWPEKAIVVAAGIYTFYRATRKTEGRELKMREDAPRHAGRDETGSDRRLTR
ncbi:MAG: hypothetical protein HYS81_03265 [Candidatus Aenigmatarchaeota archaeon]|nr:MAG: hypothetical protein HYS81_03265 [Candidatus Aenigmarchaeota archaeon]